MFCGNCGNEIKDNSTFCPECGEKLLRLHTTNENSVQEYKQPKSKRKTIIIIAVLVIFAVGIIGIFNVIFSDSAEEVAIKYAEARVVYDWKEASKYLAIDFDEYIETAADAIMDYKDESADEYFRSWQEDLEDYLEDVEINEPWDIIESCKEMRALRNKEHYGENFKIKVEITDKEEVEESEIKWYIKDMGKDQTLKKFNLDLDDFLDSSEIGKAYKMTLEVTYNGDDFDSDEKELYVVKYDGDWKILELPSVTSDVDLY